MEKKFYRVRFVVDTYYEVYATNEENAIDKAYNYMMEDYEPEFKIEKVSVEDCENA